MPFICKMDFLGHVSKIISYPSDDKPIVFRIKDQKNSYYNCSYLGFLPLREKDKVSFKAEKIDDTLVIKNKPLAIIPENIEYIKDCLYKALPKNKKIMPFYNELIDYMQDKKIITEIESWVKEKESRPEFETFSKSQLNKFLLWWERNISKRRLYLFGLFDKEIRESKLEVYQLYLQLKENPFKVDSLSMDKAAELNTLMGRKNEEKDIIAGKIIRFINEKAKQGWSAVPLSYLHQMFPNLLEYASYMQENYTIVFEEELVYNKYNHEMEIFLTNKMCQLVERNEDEKLRLQMNPNGKFPYHKFEDEIKLTDEQDLALQGALQNHISIVTGGAGCGKTTLIKQIIQNLIWKNKKFVLTAFTGKAVLKIKETVTGDLRDHCFTISRLIHKKKLHQEVPKFNILVIDEAGMVSSSLIYQFMLYFRHYFKIILIGDANQLPPIGSGHFFNQLILSKKIPVFYLSINKRTVCKDGKSNILLNANRMINNQEDSFEFSRGHGFEIMEGGIKECKALIRCLQKKGIADTEITILTPYNKDIPELIKEHQKVYLSGQEIFTYANTDYIVGDRIMQTKNIYNDENDVMNGEEGVVSEINKEGMEVVFAQDKKVFYKWQMEGEDRKPRITDEDIEDNLEKEFVTSDLKHSFCKTVHKAQGSEYNYVIFYLPSTRSDFINLNLIYTAITRTKKNIWVVGCQRTLLEGCHKKIKSYYEKLSKRIEDKINSV